MFLAEGSSREGEKPILDSSCTGWFLSRNGSCREMRPVKRGVPISLVVPGRGWQGPRPRTNQVAPASASCLHRAGMTTRSSQTPGRWATRWRRPRTRAGSARSSSTDQPSPCGRGPPSPPCSPRYGPCSAGEWPSISRARGKGLSRTVPRTASSRVTSPPESPTTPTPPHLCSHGAPGVLFLNFLIILEWSGENEMSEPGPSLFMGLMANVTDVHAGTPCINTGRGLLMRKDRTFMMSRPQHRR